MKKILITGINSYIGNEFESWVNHRNYNYDIEKNRFATNNGKKRIG